MYRKISKNLMYGGNVSEETVTVTISKKSYEFLKSLAKEIATQDNRATARPYFFGLRVQREYPVPGGYDSDKEYWIDKFGQQWDSKKELLENEPNHQDHEIKRFWTKFHREVENVFLTKRGYDQHLALNRHNLRDPDNFLYHAFRNPEFDGIFKFLEEMEKL